MTDKQLKIVVLGGAESGCGSAILAQKVGHKVFLSDNGKIAQEYIKLLVQYEIEYEQQGHSLDRILASDLVIKSPGIPDHIPLIKSIMQREIPIISELEFAGRYSSAKTICITGSNGKTTVSTLIYEMLRNGGFKVALAGNIGKSYALQVALEDYDWYVLEVSSFQLDGMYEFCSDISLLTNITPDHLDRYDYNMQNYIDSKFRVCRNHTKSKHFIYSIDDLEIGRNLTNRKIDSVHLPYSVHRTDVNAYLKDDTLSVSVDGQQFELSRSKVKLSGLHNISNILGASLGALVAGVDIETIKTTIEQFTGVEHRVERVAEIDNILYINDSKATNVDAAWYALEGMTRPVVWIAGGTDKGNDYSPLKDVVATRVETLVCMGVDNSKLIAAFDGVIPNIVSTGSLKEAMEAVSCYAKQGYVVLLSPACASFDLFDNYEHRGKLFKDSVLRLKSQSNG